MGAELRVYIQGFASPPEIVIFGAIDFSAAVGRLRPRPGYQVTICDARRPSRRAPASPRSATWSSTGPTATWPAASSGTRDVVLVFTHDPKFDEPALLAALGSGAGYIGALGSRRTHRERIARLRETGVSEADLARISAPCGLDIGARTPAETAVSIFAEIIALRTGRDGRRLAETGGSIHPRELHAD